MYFPAAFLSGPFFNPASACSLCVGKGDNEAQGSFKVSSKVLLWEFFTPKILELLMSSKPSQNMNTVFIEHLPFRVIYEEECPMASQVHQGFRHSICLRSFSPSPPLSPSPPSPPQVKYLLNRMSGPSVWPQLPGFCCMRWWAEVIMRVGGPLLLGSLWSMHKNTKDKKTKIQKTKNTKDKKTKIQKTKKYKKSQHRW